MDTMHAYDCRCGTRNHPSLTHCRRCGAPRAAGRPVASGYPSPMPPDPRRMAAAAGAFAWDGVKFVAAVLIWLLVLIGFFLNPVGSLVAFALWLLWHIYRALDRVARRIDP